MSKPVWIMCGPEGTWRHLYYRNDRDNIYCAECWRRDAHQGEQRMSEYRAVNANPGDNISNRDIQRWRSPEGYGMFADPHGGYVSVGDAEDQAFNAYANGQRDALAFLDKWMAEGDNHYEVAGVAVGALRKFIKNFIT